MEDTREKLILEVLALWSRDTEVAEEVNSRSYTDAASGYHSAQSDVEEILEMDVEHLRSYLENLKQLGENQ